MHIGRARADSGLGGSSEVQRTVLVPIHRTRVRNYGSLHTTIDFGTAADRCRTAPCSRSAAAAAPRRRPKRTKGNTASQRCRVPSLGVSNTLSSFPGEPYMTSGGSNFLPDGTGEHNFRSNTFDTYPVVPSIFRTSGIPCIQQNPGILTWNFQFRSYQVGNLHNFALPHGSNSNVPLYLLGCRPDRDSPKQLAGSGCVAKPGGLACFPR